MEEMDRLLVPLSVEFMMSSRLRFNDVNWTRATLAAAKVMRPGGKVEMNVWCQGNEADDVKLAFERAGFKDVTMMGTASAR